MKFKVGDTVLVTAGKDKGKKGPIVRVFSEDNSVVVEGMNMYSKHIKPMNGRAGEKMRLERPLATAKIAILNEKGLPDRVGYSISKDGQKTRIFKKTGTAVPEPKATKENKSK
jgi:large subunit ribosomal protein L24